MFELLLAPRADYNTDRKLVRTEGLRPDKRVSHRRTRRQANDTLKHWLRAAPSLALSPSLGV
jgi:hypothetical protein